MHEKNTDTDTNTNRDADAHASATATTFEKIILHLVLPFSSADVFQPVIFFGVQLIPGILE